VEVFNTSTEKNDVFPVYASLTDNTERNCMGDGGKRPFLGVGHERLCKSTSHQVALAPDVAADDNNVYKACARGPIIAPAIAYRSCVA
jgi:hypothetical protein